MTSAWSRDDDIDSIAISPGHSCTKGTPSLLDDGSGKGGIVG